jgi:ribosomal protein S18 acetylase RimI-like enzyme
VISAISDGVLAAYISFLEVLPDCQDEGIGSELTRRMLEQLGDLYMVDLVCDPELAPFYERQGMARLAGLAIRNRNGLRADPTSTVR